MFASTLAFVNTFPSQGAVTKGKWELSGDTWKFYNEKNEVNKGWVETHSGFLYHPVCICPDTPSLSESK